MTQTTSFKEKFRQAFSIFKWDLKFCSGTLAVYSILAAVFMTISLTLCIVFGAYTNSTHTFNNATDYAMSFLELFGFESPMQIFQIITSATIYLLTVVFTILYTIKVFSYLHNKRKADLYGSLPVSRITLFFSKSFSALIFSLVPALFFMGIMSIISICLGQTIIPGVSHNYIKLIMGTLACVSAYGLISVCCGTTFNSVIMFITVCIAYPLSTMFVKGVIGGFFNGFYSDVLRNSFITNALNPIAAYDGINVIYWIIFTIACFAGSAFLVKKRKAERAQSSFAYYLPCHIVKILVSFLMGMFFGALFGSLNVFGYGYCGFIFGFILGSVPAFIISHLIFYKGFSGLMKSSVTLAGLFVLVIAGMAICNFDVFGYTSYSPKADDIVSAGYIDTSATFIQFDENINEIVKNSAEDFNDEKSIKKIMEIHRKKITENDRPSNEKFMNVWYDILQNNLTFDRNYGIAFKLKNGSTVTRIYSDFLTYYVSSYDEDYSEVPGVATNDILKSKKYIQKYSGIARADKKQCNDLVISNMSNYNIMRSAVVISDERNNSESNYNDCEKIREAFMKDFAADQTRSEMVLSLYYGNPDEYEYDYDEYDDSYVDNSFNYYKSKYPDLVCQIDFTAENTEISNGIEAIFNGIDIDKLSFSSETYLIPKSYTNTIKVLKELNILNDDLTINKKSQYYNIFY